MSLSLIDLVKRKIPFFLWPVFLHFPLLFVIATILPLLGFNVTLHNNYNLLNWDAQWYYSIKEFGYHYVEGRTNNLAFFPFFPYIWKVFNFSALTVSVFNSFLFLLSFSILGRSLKFDIRLSALFLSIPSMIFMYLPYSESLFFCGTSLILLGLYRNQMLCVILGIIIASTTRSVSIVLIPSFLFTMLVVEDFTKRNILKYLCFIVVSVVCTFIVFLIQYLQTNEWFAFFKVQESWNRSLSMPILPFTTLSGYRILWLDGIALMIVFFCVYDCCIFLRNRFFFKEKKIPKIPYIFSAGFLACMGCISIFFSGVWHQGEGTSLMSLNRYILATPFLVCYLYEKTLILKMPHPWILPVLLIVACFVLGAFSPFSWAHLLYFAMMASYVFLLFENRKQTLIIILLYICGMTTQVFLLNMFFVNQWVG